MAACKSRGLPLGIVWGSIKTDPRVADSLDFALTENLHDAREGRPIRVKGTGDSVRSYLYAADLTAWLWNRFLGIPGTEVFNLGSKEPIRLIDLARKISLMVGVGLSIDEIRGLSSARTNYYVPAISKKDLSIQPSGLRKLEHILESLLCSKKFRGPSFS